MTMNVSGHHHRHRSTALLYYIDNMELKKRNTLNGGGKTTLSFDT